MSRLDELLAKVNQQAEDRKKDIENEKRLRDKLQTSKRDMWEYFFEGLTTYSKYTPWIVTNKIVDGNPLGFCINNGVFVENPKKIENVWFSTIVVKKDDFHCVKSGSYGRWIYRDKPFEKVTPFLDELIDIVCHWEEQQDTIMEYAERYLEQKLEHDAISNKNSSASLLKELERYNVSIEPEPTKIVYDLSSDGYLYVGENEHYRQIDYKIYDSDYIMRDWGFYETKDSLKNVAKMAYEEWFNDEFQDIDSVKTIEPSLFFETVKSHQPGVKTSLTGDEIEIVLDYLREQFPTVINNSFTFNLVDNVLCESTDGKQNIYEYIEQMIPEVTETEIRDVVENNLENQNKLEIEP